MSPNTARQLKVGDHIAKRNNTSRINFAHVGQVTKKTGKAFYVYFGGRSASGIRIAFDDGNALANLRRADVREAAGYQAKHE